MDAWLPSPASTVGVIVFSHGFKGFKDWGHWSLLGQEFATNGFLFVAYNFSHNGTTPAHPTAFDDLDAFAKNTFSKELFDLETVISWLTQSGDHPIPVNDLPVYLAGHSRGGPISLIMANESERVAGLMTWASVATLDYAWPNQQFIDQWKEEGYYTVENKRTGQTMRIDYTLYEDFQAHRDRLDTEAVARWFDKPWLIVHGTTDPAVPEAAARQLQEWNSKAELQLLSDADHVFGAFHPFDAPRLPEHSSALLRCCLAFLRKQIH